ncbi:nuclear transport factor 2 family protein [Variovorax sp. OV329]|uniref:nuclear transport factor 2 family protein n=1 Tax=Variovorax sp. OV329 TaxID=1882825 RepID=UPI0008ECE3FD|nr:nuclear transport factor 2 family protein [Variovorax sp. OV329]SFL90062.1 hypothetical protein SAMN05444747_101189 [Variovorax sp. OV329]
MTSASEHPLQVYARAWAEGDLRAMFAMYHDDVVFRYFGTHPLAGVHRGKTAAMAAMKDFSLRTQRQLVRLVDVMEGQDCGAIVSRESFAQGGTRLEVERMLRYRLQDGKIIECWVYDEDQRLVDSLVAQAPPTP